MRMINLAADKVSVVICSFSARRFGRSKPKWLVRK